MGNLLTEEQVKEKERIVLAMYGFYRELDRKLKGKRYEEARERLRVIYQSSPEHFSKESILESLKNDSPTIREPIISAIERMVRI